MFNANSKIKFYCDPRCKGIIPPPYPAKKLIPDWYKRLEMVVKEGDFLTPTLKRCPPFIDAMSAGWIIPLAADIRFNIQDAGTGISWEHDFFYPMIENHSLKQISTHPSYPLVPIKIINHWIIETPPDWSCIFTPPLNRPDDFIDLLTGIVETDKYFEYVNFPGFLKVLSENLTLSAGHPLMQVIPFHRKYMQETIIESLDKNKIKKLNKTRDLRASHRSLYRDSIWKK